MKKRLLTMLTLSANLFLFGCADNQARAQIADLNNRLSQMQDSLSSVDNKVSGQKSLDIVNKMSDIQDQIDQINGSVSTLSNNQKKFQNTQNQVNQSLQQQINGVSASSTVSSSAGRSNNNKPQASAAAVVGAVDASAPVASDDNPKNASAPIGGDDKKNLKTAFNEIKAHNFKKAIADLKNIVANSNDQTTVGTATYYLAVAYAASGNYKNSIASAKKYIGANPDGHDVPNALRTIYISQSQLGLQKSALKTARVLIKKFPNSEAAEKVKAQISQ